MSDVAADARAAFSCWVTLPVRWGDMDAFGHVNNACYFTYCESARIRYFAEIELERFKEGAADGPALVTATCNFIRQVHYPATLEVGARATKVGNKSFHLDYLIVRQEDGAVVADGTSVVAWVDYGVGKAIPLPAPLKERIRAYDGLAAAAPSA